MSWIPIKETPAYLKYHFDIKISVHSLYKWAEKNENLPFRKIGGRLFIHDQVLQEKFGAPTLPATPAASGVPALA